MSALDWLFGLESFSDAANQLEVFQSRNLGNKMITVVSVVRSHPFVPVLEGRVDVVVGHCWGCARTDVAVLCFKVGY